jgi:hypothetical protein
VYDNLCVIGNWGSPFQSPCEGKTPWQLVPRHYEREVGLAEC